MIEGKLNQIALWKRVTGKNEYGEPITVDADIRVRWEGKRRLVRDAMGQEVISEALVFCLEDVQPGDVLVWQEREWPIIMVSEIISLNGTTSHREVAL